MHEWILALVCCLYGATAALIAGERRKLRIVLVSPIVLIGFYFLIAVGIVSANGFRALFPTQLQFWGSVLVGQALIASAFFATGWMLKEGIRQKKKDYQMLCLILFFGVPVVYLKIFSIDYATLSDAPQGGDYIKQTTSYTCSAASLANACYLFDRELSEQDAARLMRLNRFGGSVCQITYALDAIDFSFREIQEKSIDDLVFPAILIVDHGGIEDGHAILIKEKEGGVFMVIDPLIGSIQSRTKEWFQDNWNGSGVENISDKASVLSLRNCNHCY